MIIGKEILRYDIVDSTNDEAKRLIASGHGEGLVVVAAAQSKGRGKQGSHWASPAGMGLYLSAVVLPFKDLVALVPITLVVAKAVGAAIEKASGLKTEIKPPNDVLLNGKKICGVLVERLVSGHVIIGLGVNVNTPAAELLPAKIGQPATSLLLETGRESDLESFFHEVLATLDHRYLAYLNEI
ncbi:MAG: biotin--[acetyl-CoA-carboxylase] ligase [Candidatus Saganbacteria bacterium]|nr:biotin--[acetyl-CoA-carboxylase] ligase [Candidatus Saganbacteria bacterium]